MFRVEGSRLLQVFSAYLGIDTTTGSCPAAMSARVPDLLVASRRQARLHRTPIHPIEARVIPARHIGRTGVHLLRPHQRKLAASLTTDWDDDRVVAVRSDPMR